MVVLGVRRVGRRGPGAVGGLVPRGAAGKSAELPRDGANTRVVGVNEDEDEDVMMLDDDDEY